MPLCAPATDKLTGVPGHVVTVDWVVAGTVGGVVTLIVITLLNTGVVHDPDETLRR